MQFLPSSGCVRSSICTTWTLTKHIENMLDGNCTRMLQAILNKSLR